jgi:hypothetical protein
MNLRDVLQLPEFLNLSDADALVYGNEVVVVATDSTPYTWSGIGLKLISNYYTNPTNPASLSPLTWFKFNDGLPSLKATVEGEEVFVGPTLFNCFNSGGFDASDSMNRGLIVQLEVNEPNWAQDTLNAILALGITQGSRWQKYKVAGTVTFSMIQAARAAIVAQSVRDALSNRWNLLVAALDAGQVLSEQAGKNKFIE